MTTGIYYVTKKLIISKVPILLVSGVFVLHFHVLIMLINVPCTVFKFLLPVLHLSLKMIHNYIEILWLHQRFIAFVACIIDTVYLLGIIFILKHLYFFHLFFAISLQM